MTQSRCQSAALGVVVCALGASLAPGVLAAGGTVELVAVVEREVATVGADGQERTQRVEAKKVVPGEEVIFTTQYANVGDDVAEDLVISNPIPEHVRFKAGSAFGDGALVTYSVDGGKTFDVPERLTVTDRGVERPATVADYTHVRWVVGPALEPGASGFVGFRAVLL